MDRIRKIFKYLELLNTRGFWFGFIAGVFYFSYIFWWLWSLYPLNWLGIDSKTAALSGLAFIFVSCVAITALWWGIAGFIFLKILRKGIYPKLTPLIFASIFTLSEYLRSLFFSIVWFGNGGIIAPNWPLGNLAHLFINFYPVSITASLWGIYGITFFLGLIVSGLILIFIRPELKKIFILEIVISALLVYSVGHLRILRINGSDNLPAVKISIIQTNTLFNTTSDAALIDFQSKLKLLKEAASIEEGIIILPEGSDIVSGLSRFLNTQGLARYFNNLSPKELLIIDNFRVPDEDVFKSRTIFINSKKGAVGSYDKQVMTPMGEFLPYILRLPLAIINPDFVTNFKINHELAVGNDSNILKYGDISIRLLICSELLSPNQARTGNSDLLVITGNYSAWHDGDDFKKAQVLPAIRFRAIESGKYTVFAANSGQSYIINPEGMLEKTTLTDGYELLTGSVVPNHNRTWYNYVGDWPILLLSSAFFGLGLRKIRNGTKS